MITKYLAILLSTSAMVACAPQTSVPDNTSVAPASENSAIGQEKENEELTSEAASEKVAERSAYNQVPFPPNAVLVGSDPQQIALNVFGIPEPVEGNFQQEVGLVEQTQNRALLTLTQSGFPDDSIEGMRYLLEFRREGDQWQLDWAGLQVSCYPNRGSQELTTENCF
jgi:hypothetical protein